MRGKAAMGFLYLIFIIGILTVICAIEYWQITVAIVVILTIIILIAKSFSSNKVDKKLVYQSIKELQSYVEKVNRLKTSKGRLQNIDAALKIIDELEELDPSSEILLSRKETKTMLIAYKSMIPINEALSKYDKAMFKGQNKQALDALLDVLYIIHKEGTTNDMFKYSDHKDDSKNQLTIEFLHSKAKSLGWDGNQ